MTTEARRERTLLLGALLVALALIGLAWLGAGCATLRKTLSATTAGAEVAAKITGSVCDTLASSWCKTNPCPQMQQCNKAEALLVQGATCVTEAAKLINALPKEVIDGR